MNLKTHTSLCISLRRIRWHHGRLRVGKNLKAYAEPRLIVLERDYRTCRNRMRMSHRGVGSLAQTVFHIHRRVYSPLTLGEAT